MIIDAHCHIYPEKIALKASQSTGNFYSIPMKYDGTISQMFEAGDEAGIDKFIVESVATTPKQVSSINHFIADTVNQYPERLYGLGTLHPDSENIFADIEEIQILGLKGVKLHPDIQEFKLDDYRCLKIYEICEQKNIPILVHTGDKRYDYSNPNRLLPILQIYKSLTFIGAHFGGWSMWVEAAEQLHGIKNLYVDCSSSFFALDDATIIKLIDMYGTDRVLFGTDYPMWSMKETVDRLKSLGYSKEDLDKIFYKNAVKVFSL